MTKFLSIELINTVTGKKLRDLTNLNAGLPEIDGLTLVFLASNDGVIEFMCTCPDGSVLPKTKAIKEIQESKFNALAESTFNALKFEKSKEIYTACQDKIDELTSWYHSIEISESALRDSSGQIEAAIDAVDEASAVLAAPLLVIEANAGEISVQELATLIKEKRDHFRDAKDVLTGTRSKIARQLAAVPYDPSDIKKSFRDINIINIDLS